MNFSDIQKQEQQNIMPTYGRFPVAIVRGTGAAAVDSEGKTYLDFTSGIGVNALGYSDAKWAQAVAEQAATLQHTSNLYYTKPQIELAQMLHEKSGFGKVFFANSGAEANECAIKLARKYSTDQYGEQRTKIVTLVNSFHGRTITTLAATGQDTFHHYFNPFTEGFVYAEADNMDSVRDCVDDHTCAVFIELIQGEGGVRPLSPEFVRELAAFCKNRDILLMVDEVQTGIARTGKLFCYEHFGIQPDVITSAKGLGGGLPIGACLCTEALGQVLNSGMHGSTFGGNPVACAGALSVLERVSEQPFLKEVTEKGAYLQEKLSKIEGVSEVRGMGMMLGAVLENTQAKDVAAACVEHGLLILTAKTLLRLLPPLNISYEEIDRGMEILEQVIRSCSASNKNRKG
ncbi:MAG: aspartate aminotransferase family protein [Clostridiales bacterium]|jgi:acetylornithine/N-succinyldiaminopimelate aminotransferase|nr:aspartate aminotransferase family protein [Clostridiales bacterium]